MRYRTKLLVAGVGSIGAGLEWGSVGIWKWIGVALMVLALNVFVSCGND
jgi:hypothetical protein